MNLLDFAKLLSPPLLVQIYRSLQTQMAGQILDRDNSWGLVGDFCSWKDALTASTGYDSEIILEKTKAAIVKVKTGEAAYERDSVLFDEIQYAWPLLAGLMWVAARNGGVLNVLDFGGSLGSTYFQNRSFLSGLPGVRWNIVEQSRHVEIGKAYFEDSYLHFYADIADCLAETQPNVVLLSSVLQYLERPYTVLDQILGLSCEHVIIDRTPFWTGTKDRLCVQTVPPSVYQGSYPSWIFSRERFHDHLYEDWKVMVTFDTLDKLVGPIDFVYQGLIIVRSNHIS